jgi:RNA polymerase sigma-70 factor (ECF subfamily)
MSDSSVRTLQLHGWLERMRAGDRAARDELLQAVCGRLEQLARKMLRRFPNVQRWTETGDVLNSALVRLLRSLERMEAPASMRDFFALAAEHMRRELLDLARHFASSKGPRAVQLSQLPDDSRGPSYEPAAPDEDPGELERWCSFHHEVEQLPAEEREVVGLIFYHGWAQADVAQLFAVHERTIRRRWTSAMVRLHHVLGEGAGAAVGRQK